MFCELEWPKFGVNLSPQGHWVIVNIIHGNHGQRNQVGYILSWHKATSVPPPWMRVFMIQSRQVSQTLLVGRSAFQKVAAQTQEPTLQESAIQNQEFISKPVLQKSPGALEPLFPTYNHLYAQLPSKSESPTLSPLSLFSLLITLPLLGIYFKICETNKQGR